MLRSLTTYRSLALSLSRSAAVLALTLTGRRPGECNHNKRETPSSSSIGVARGKAEYKTQTLHTHTHARSYTVGRSHSLTHTLSCALLQGLLVCALPVASSNKNENKNNYNDGQWRHMATASSLYSKCKIHCTYLREQRERESGEKEAAAHWDSVWDSPNGASVDCLPGWGAIQKTNKKKRRKTSVAGKITQLMRHNN